MTKMKKLTSVLLAAAMAASLMVPAWAAKNNESILSQGMGVDNSIENENHQALIAEAFDLSEEQGETEKEIKDFICNLV